MEQTLLKSELDTSQLKVLIQNMNNIYDKSDEIRRCSFRKISQNQERQLNSLFEESSDMPKIEEYCSKGNLKVESVTDKINKFFKNSLHMVIYVNESNSQQFKEQWKIQLTFPFKVTSPNLSYQSLITLQSFSTIDYDTAIKSQLLGLFPIHKMREHPQNNWNHLVKDRLLLLKLCEIVTHQSSQGRIEQFQNYLNKIVSKEQAKNQCGQQIKFIQDSNRRKDGFNMVSQLQAYEQTLLKRDNILNYQESNKKNNILKNVSPQFQDQDQISKDIDERVKDKKKRSRKSKYHGLSRLLLYAILDLFKQQNMENLQIPIEVQQQLCQVVKRVKKSGKFSIKKNSEDLATRVVQEKDKTIKTDFYNHSHYNALFLILNPTSIRQMRDSFKDLQIHKFVYGIDLSNILLDQSKIAFINVLKAYSYSIFYSSLSEFLQGLDKHQIRDSCSEIFTQVQESKIHKSQQILKNIQVISNTENNLLQQSPKAIENENQQINSINNQKESNIFNMQIRKKYLKRVYKSISYLSQGIQVLRF